MMNILIIDLTDYHRKLFEFRIRLLCAVLSISIRKRAEMTFKILLRSGKKLLFSKIRKMLLLKAYNSSAMHGRGWGDGVGWRGKVGVLWEGAKPWTELWRLELWWSHAAVCGWGRRTKGLGEMRTSRGRVYTNIFQRNYFTILWTEFDRNSFTFINEILSNNNCM